jgi:integrase
VNNRREIPNDAAANPWSPWAASAARTCWCSGRRRGQIWAGGELLNLRWTDLDLDAKKITITGSTAVIGGERVNGTTKSGRKRVVSIDDETVAVLRQHKADQAAEQLLAGESWHGIKDGYVFMTGWGEPIYPDTVTALMTKVIHAHNGPEKGPRPKDQLPHARLHDLRHIHATTLLLSGVPVHVVAARLGHADPAITLRVYAHVIRAAETAAADIFAQAVKSSPSLGSIQAELKDDLAKNARRVADGQT